MQVEIINVEDKPKRRGGRPRKAPAALRNKRLNIRFTEAEYAQLCEKAAATNLTPTDYAHAQIIGADIPNSVPKINIDMYRWLQPLSTNINELARKAHTGEQMALSPDLLERISNDLRNLRKALIGVKK